MDKTILVTPDFATGYKILDALDGSDLGIAVALWGYFPEYEDWRYVVASRKLDEAGPFQGYYKVHAALEAANIPVRQGPSMFVMKMSDPFIRGLRRLFGKTKSVEGMRFGGQLIGDRFVEDGLAYRIR